MITLKYWNNLTSQCRAQVAERFYGTQYFADSVKEEYHHAFEHDITGKMLKVLLSACYLKDGQIEVRCMVGPSFKPKTSGSSNKPKVSKPTPKRYYFRMYTESDPEDGESIWEVAYSESEARQKAYSDFHSIVRLDLIRVV